MQIHLQRRGVDLCGKSLASGREIISLEKPFVHVQLVRRDHDSAAT